MSRYVEEYEVGKPFPLSPGRTISEADINLFAGLVGDFTPIHVDANYAGKTAFGGRIAHGTLTMSTAIGLLTQLNLLGEGVIALLNLNFDFKGVVMIGDTIYARVTPAEARKSSKPGAGVVKFAFEVINQRDELIQVGIMTVLMKTMDHPVPIQR
ncbi:MAG TPA: MaoC/PaaZ C-terminal domain-containing protein [Alphaproteobacteria bacterium]|jgi:acyl dehydratase|nr:MaoC/PaaZ C-terminal domain-containing protein [Alphaproteobacteria bacterium]